MSGHLNLDVEIKESRLKYKCNFFDGYKCCRQCDHKLYRRYSWIIANKASARCDGGIGIVYINWIDKIKFSNEIKQLDFLKEI